MRSISLLSPMLFLGSLFILNGCDKDNDEGGKPTQPKVEQPKPEPKKEETAKAIKNEKHNEAAGDKKIPNNPERYGWNSWRGPTDDGISPETGLPDKIEADKAVWTFPISG